MSPIIDEIEQTARVLFADGSVTTAAVAKAFGDLGLSKLYFVASSAYKKLVEHDPSASKNVDGGWLYDLCWYTREKSYKKLVLVLESELDKPKQDRIPNDFGKLVQARATVRVWITARKSREMIDMHIDDCMESARAFGESRPGDDVYIFAIYDQSTKAVFTRKCVV